MCQPIIEVMEDGQWRKTCPNHPQEKLREGQGCRICSWGNRPGQKYRLKGVTYTVTQQSQASSA